MRLPTEGWSQTIEFRKIFNDAEHLPIPCVYVTNTQFTKMISSINGISTPDEILQAYTTMFLLLGSSVSDSPEHTGLPSYCHQGLLRQLPVESNNSRFVSASRLLMSPCSHRGSCRTSISGSYHTLFASDDPAEAKPVASAWVSEKVLEMSDSLAACYQRYSFEKSTCCDLPDDHLGIELLFVNMMIEKYLTEDDVQIKEMIRRDLLGFIETNMLPWVTKWSSAVAGRSVTKCYTGIAGLVVGGLEDVRDLLK